MDKFSDVLFTSDFDHTLSAPDSTVPKSNIEAIEYFIAHGGKFCLNSGRSVPLLRCRVHEIPTNAPCLCYNGAACYDYATESLIYANILPDFAPELVSLVQNSGLNVCMEVQRFDNHYEIHRQLPARLKFLAQEGLHPFFCDENVPKPWMKLIVCGADGETVSERLEDIPKADFDAFLRLQKRIDEYCAGRCYVTRSMPRLIEISNPDCNKGKAARALANELGRKILVCAGDAPNDEQMLREADFAFCPSDADKSILHIEGIYRTDASDVGCVAGAIAKLEKLL
ncbi:MAG: HAD-IIB family hydrolase [Ruminococcaceae bacterium]|nr:HAD-IIB family hydrolase [Oscillospiraceae bacterium]